MLIDTMFARDMYQVSVRNEWWLIDIKFIYIVKNEGKKSESHEQRYKFVQNYNKTST